MSIMMVHCKNLCAAFRMIVLGSCILLVPVCYAYRDPENVVGFIGGTAMLEYRPQRRDSLGSEALGTAVWRYVSHKNDTHESFVSVESITEDFEVRSDYQGVYRLYLRNLHFDNAGMYQIHSPSGKFDARAAYIVTVAHRPVCEVQAISDENATLSCYITYQGQLNVRLVWSGPGAVGGVVDEKNFTSKANGISSHKFQITVPVNSFHADEYSCRVNFFGRDTFDDVATNEPTFTAGVCHTAIKSHVQHVLAPSKFTPVATIMDELPVTNSSTVATSCPPRNEIVVPALVTLSVLLSVIVVVLVVYICAKNKSIICCEVFSQLANKSSANISSTDKSAASSSESDVTNSAHPIPPESEQLCGSPKVKLTNHREFSAAKFFKPKIDVEKIPSSAKSITSKRASYTGSVDNEPSQQTVSLLSADSCSSSKKPNPLERMISQVSEAGACDDVFQQPNSPSVTACESCSDFTASPSVENDQLPAYATDSESCTIDFALKPDSPVVDVQLGVEDQPGCL